MSSQDKSNNFLHDFKFTVYPIYKEFANHITDTFPTLNRYEVNTLIWLILLVFCLIENVTCTYCLKLATILKNILVSVLYFAVILIKHACLFVLSCYLV